MKVKLTDVVINNRKRSIDFKKVTELSESIKEIGLLNPITITSNNILVAGNHRLEACKVLGHKEIKANVIEKEGLYLELAEIDENLIRNELHYIDRGKHLARRKEIYEELNPETKKGAVNQYTANPNKSEKQKSFTQETSEKLNVSRDTIENEIKIARDIAPEVQEVIKDKEVPKTDALQVARMKPEEQKYFSTKIKENNDAKKIIEEIKKPHVSNNSGNNEWYTPKKYIDIALSVMGTIDLDPASSDIANKTVKAKTYYTCNNNGLNKEWLGNVWMNPPYSQPLIQQFCEKLVKEIKENRVKQSCVLVNNATETAWFQALLEKASAIWFIKSRVKFIDINGNPSGAPLQGQCILYFGDNVNKFKEICGGVVYVNR